MTQGFSFPETASVNKRPRRMCGVLAELFAKDPTRWGQGKWGHPVPAQGDLNANPPEGCRCVYSGMLDISGHDKDVTFEALQHFCVVNGIPVSRVTHVTRVAIWNDMKGRTVNEVIDALYRAAGTPLNTEPRGTLP